MEPFLADIASIAHRYIRNEVLSQKELDLLRQWAAAGEGRQDWLDELKRDPDSEYVQGQLDRMQNVDSKAIWSQIETQTFTPLVPIARPTVRRRRAYMTAAIILLIGAGAAGWWLLPHHSGTSLTPATTQPIAASDIQPGGNKAVLTLADGRRIDLDTSANGILTHQGNMKVSKLADGQLAYNKVKTSDEKPQARAYNSLSTPRAGQFTLRLPDGTNVWLNNASIIRYPVAFTGVDRTVEIAGEAYFEIAKDASHPFRVIVHRGPAATGLASLASDAVPVTDEGGTIEVLGTSFNVMAYNDEPAELTTLVNGSIRFTRDGAGVLLHPEEQSVLDANSVLHVLPKVDVAEVTAWKNGYFNFDHASFQTTMRQLARWYDITVTYHVQPTGQEFQGGIQRNLPLSVILKALENEHIHFKLEGRDLTVLP
jgi:ferric-dicitrate binding protein FerR (iron transport regulator)